MIDDRQRENITKAFSKGLDRHWANSDHVRDEAREEGILRAFNEMVALCGSEVEARLLTHIVFVLGVGSGFGIGSSQPRSDKEIGHIFVQAPIGAYKADILIECTLWDRYEPLKIVVECDGPWHDKCDQYHGDRKRDRWMQAQGYRVFRFPTAEIQRRGESSCANEVLEGIVAHLNRENEELATGVKFRRAGNAIRGG